MHRSMRLVALGAGWLLAGCVIQLPPETSALAYAEREYDPLPLAQDGDRFVLPDELEAARLATRDETDDKGRTVKVVVFENNTATKRENVLRLRPLVDMRNATLFGGRAEAAFTPESLRARLALEFGRVRTSPPMRRVNRSGGYTYVAAMPSTEVSCVFAWQVVDNANVGELPGPYAVELRLCDAERSESELVALFDRVAVLPNYM